MIGFETLSHVDIYLKLYEERLTFVSNDCRLQIKHEELPIDVFWISMRVENPLVVKKRFNYFVSLVRSM